MQSDIIAAAEIKSFFESFPTRVFWPSDLVQLCRRYKMAWRVPRRTSPAEFVEWLLENTAMTTAELRSANYPPITRYICGKGVSPVLIALSTRRDSYLSHGSALWVHGVGGSERQIT